MMSKSLHKNVRDDEKASGEAFLSGRFQITF